MHLGAGEHHLWRVDLRVGLQLRADQGADLGGVAAELAQQALRPAEGLKPGLEVGGRPVFAQGLGGVRRAAL
jgi:hypothetical protein